MAEAGGVGICRGIENTQIIEKASCSKRPKRRNWTNWNVSKTWKFRLPATKVGLVYRCLAGGWRAVAK